MPLRHLAALLLAGSPAAALAQQGADDPSDIVVTGRGLADPIGDRAFDVVEIGRDRIQANAAGRLESVLADVTGLQQFRRSDSRSANPTSQGITLRGLGGNAASRVQLILDGVPQADPFGGWVAFPAYAVGRLGRIRVTRGGGSGLYGPGALAGVVELESATPDQVAPLDGAVSYGGRDSIDAQAAASLIRPGGFATLSAAYARGDGFVPTVAEQRGPADRPALYRQASGQARAVVEVAPAVEAQATLSAFTDRRERGTAFTGNRSQGADASLRLVGRGHWGWSALAYLQTRDFASSFAAVDAARTTATRTLDQYATPATGTGARIDVEPPTGPHVRLRLGGDWRIVDGRTQELYTYVAGTPTRRRVAGGSNRTLGLFADGGWEAGAVTLSLGGRIDRWRIADGFLSERPLAPGAPLAALRFADRDGTETTGRAGVAWRIASPLTLRAAAYSGWRLPTLNELYRPFRVGLDATAPDPSLNPERLRGIETGATLTPTATTSIAATLFRNRLRGAIANVTAGAGSGTFPLVGFVAANGTYRVRRNLDAVASDGIELDASWRPGPFAFRASWTHLDPKVEASGAAAALDGLRPAQTPRDQLSIGADARWRVWSGGATLRRLSSQYDEDANARRLAAATTLDATLTMTLARGWAVEARAENLGDARVEAGVSGAGVIERATPRTLWLGLRAAMR